MAPTPDDANPSRRSFLQAGAASILLAGSPSPARAGDAPGDGLEWRNKQAGMAYRRLGRTNLMISEVVCGGDPITLKNYKHLELALDLGLNYLDMAPAYNGGDTERAYGKILGGSSSKREKVFLTTKVSDFKKVRNRIYREIFDGLPESKKGELVKRAKALETERGVTKPGYFFEYYPGQKRDFDPAYLRVAMMPEFGHKVEGSEPIRRVIVESLEGSLKRVGTDHFDLLMCPHGADTPEDLSMELVEVVNDLKAQGKVRFLGFTAHNDPGGNLRRAAELGHYDAAMVAYNVINGGYLNEALNAARSRDMGVIAMKAAHAVATHHKSLQPIPAWRVAKVERVVPGDLKPPMKAYLWSLQDPRISAVISNLWDETFVKENLGLAGKKVELQSA